MASLVGALDGLVLERLPDGRFARRGELPSWCRELGSATLEASEPFAMDDVFPFLEVFLPDAERVWREPGAKRIDSELWTESAVDGRAIHLEAVALDGGGVPLLVLTRNDRMFAQQQLVLQRARELRAAHDALTREQEEKDVLVHCIVHDLATPLHGILGALSLIDEQELVDRTRQWVRVALDAATRQREMIRDILYVFSAERGVTEPADATGDLCAAIERVASELEPVARVRRVRLAAPLGRASHLRDCRVIGDEARLARAIGNLVENAIRHSPADGKVELRLREERSAILLTIDDEGPGVAPELVAQLFQKFGRGRERGAGTGLGLYFCRITLERWGGGVGYERRAEGGARFWARFRRPHAAAVAPERRALRGDTESQGVS